MPKIGPKIKRAIGSAMSRLRRRGVELEPALTSASTMKDLSEFQRQMGWQDINEAQDRKSRYERYDQIMLAMPPLAQAIDIRCCITLQPDRDTKRVISVKAPQNQRIIDILGKMFDRTNLPQHAHEALGYGLRRGDDFRERIITREGILGFRYFEPWRIRIITDKIGSLAGFQYIGERQYYTSPQEAQGKDIFQRWQIQHFKRSVSLPYGQSPLYESESRVREYQWMMLSIMMGRIFNSIQRLEHVIDVTGCKTKAEKKDVLRMHMLSQDRGFITRFIDATTNQLRSITAPAVMPGDLYTLVSRDGSEKAGVKVIPGQRGFSEIKDAELVREEALSRMGVPLRLVGLGKETISRAELTEQDKMLLRLCLFDQEWIKERVIYPACEIELALHGINTMRKGNDYTVELADLDTGERLVEARTGKLTAQIYDILAKTETFDPAFLQRRFLNMSPEEIAESAKAIEAFAKAAQALAKAGAPDGGTDGPGSQLRPQAA